MPTTFHKHRPWHGTLRRITIKRDTCGDYWLYIITDYTDFKTLPTTGESVGADFGLSSAYLTFSTGEKIHHPQPLKQSLNKLRHLNKALNRKQKGSHRETLNLEGMKRLWGRKVSELAFYQFVEILKYKCSKHKRMRKQIGQWTATTKPCSDCGFHNENLTLKDRLITCPDCGSHHDRDINAARNILRAGIAVT